MSKRTGWTAYRSAPPKICGHGLARRGWMAYDDGEMGRPHDEMMTLIAVTRGLPSAAVCQ